MRKSILQLGLMAAMAEGMGNLDGFDIHRPTKGRPTSKPATLTRKQWLKRKRKLEVVRQSRKANR